MNAAMRVRIWVEWRDGIRALIWCLVGGGLIVAPFVVMPFDRVTNLPWTVVVILLPLWSYFRGINRTRNDWTMGTIYQTLAQPSSGLAQVLVKVGAHALDLAVIISLIAVAGTLFQLFLGAVSWELYLEHALWCVGMMLPAALAWFLVGHTVQLLYRSAPWLAHWTETPLAIAVFLSFAGLDRLLTDLVGRVATRAANCGLPTGLDLFMEPVPCLWQGLLQQGLPILLLGGALLPVAACLIERRIEA